MAQILREVKIVRVVPTGTGSKRITIPKRMLDAVLGESEYATVAHEDDHIIVRPVKLQPMESRSRRKS
jgi:hypothetical protein